MITRTRALSSILLLIVFRFLLGISETIGDIVRLIVLLLIITIIVTWICTCTSRRSDTKAWKNYERIKKELKWLRTLLEDKNIVSKSGERIDKKAHDLWSTEELWPLKTARLEGSVEDWVNESEEITQRVWNLIEKIEKTGKIRSEDRSLEGPMENIKKLFEKKGKDAIYGELTRLRSKIRRLLDGPVENEQKSVKSDHKDCSEKIDQLLSKKSVGEMEGPVRKARLHLQLLRAFLHDLGGFALESEMEKAWVKEAKALVAQVSSASDQPEKQKPWSSIWSSTKEARRELVEFNEGLSDLFIIKESYGLKFIRGEPWQASRNETRDDKNLLSELKELKKHVSDGFVGFKEVTEKSEEVLREFEDAIAKEGITHSTKERSDQMNNLFKEANRSVERYERDSAKKSGFPQKNAQKILDRKKKLMMEDLDILQRSIKAYTIELNKEKGSVVAMEEDTDALVSLLTSGGVEPFVVSIVGMRGIGKTTLAKKAFECTKARTHFEHRFWVNINGRVADHGLPELVAEQVGVHGSPEGQNLIINVNNHLMQKGTYLVVLDNFATEGWRDVEKAFPKTDGSRVLLTTRSKKEAAKEDKGIGTHAVRLRTKEESWRLFQARVNLPDSEVKELAERTVGKCGGLPLEILDFAYLMAGIDVNDPQLAVKLKDIDLCPSPSSENSGLTKRHLNPSPWSENFNLTKSYWNKDKPSGRFLDVFLIFPEDYEIPARRLLAFWYARERGDKELEAEPHLKRLIDSNMIQVVETNLDEEDVKYCVPKFLRRRREWELKWDHSHKHTDDRSLKTRQILIRDNFFLSFHTGEGPKIGEEIVAELRRGIRGKVFLNLRVLDLEHAFKPQLPDSIRDLKELRYLGLRWTYIQIIPYSVGELTNLQTLDIEHTCIHEVPDSIWRLKKLRHLYLNHSYRSKIVHQGSANYLSKFSLTNSINPLKNLRTLSGVFIDEDSFQPNQLKKLTSLTKLGLAFQLTSPNGKKLADCVVNFSQLKSLRLSSIDEFGEAQDLWLERLPANLKKLSSLYLCGKLTAYGQSVEDKFPKSLSDLTLSASGLSVDPMPILGEHLRGLKTLCFYSDSYRGKKMVSRKGDFPKLLLLRLRKLELLEEILVEEGAMENLRELEIRFCSKLQVPIGLKHLKSLQQLKLLEMEKKFKEEEVRKQIWSTWPEIAYSPKIINDYQKI